jgi:pantoate--beta-alanine ligase
VSAQLFHDVDELREMLARVRRMGATVGLVPTMGALHEGHGCLMDAARRETDCVVVSIFVNPIQFDRQEDLERYPRTLDADVRFSGDRGADIVFAPLAEQMYPEPQRAFVDVTRVSEELCGRFRPGHFRGVATVVLKLFNIIQPDRAYFGEKDAQQLAVIRRMVRDLNLPVEVVPVATVREADGLALSSRNKHLSAQERKAAPILFQALLAAQKLIAGGSTEAAEVKGAALAVLGQQPLGRVEYLEIVDPDDMQLVERIVGPVRVTGAIWLGSTRLIDNMLCEPGPPEAPGLIQ